MVQTNTTAEIPGWAHFPKIDDAIKNCFPPLPPSHIMGRVWVDMHMPNFKWVYCTYRAEITKSALWYLSPHIRYGQSGSVDQCNITRGTYLAIYSEFHGESVVLLPITALLPQKQTKSALWYLTPHIRFGQSELVVQYNTARGTQLPVYSQVHEESVVLLPISSSPTPKTDKKRTLAQCNTTRGTHLPIYGQSEYCTLLYIPYCTLCTFLIIRFVQLH